MALAVVVGNVIGSGIFLKPGNIAGDSGNFPLIISVWVLGGVLCLLGALCFAELGTMLPRAGGLYVYLREAYGRLPAFLFGWNDLLFNRPAGIGALAVAFVGTVTLALQWEVSATTQVILASLLIAITAWVNIIGVLWGGRLQMLTTVIKAGFLGLVALTPFVLIPFSTQSVDVAHYSTSVAPNYSSLGAQVGVVLLAVMWAYNGWHGITPLAEEVRDPDRNIPRALFGGIGILTVLYTAANLAYHGVLPMEEMKAAGDHAAEQMLGRLFGPIGIAFMSGVIMCSTFGGINSNLLHAPRVTFAMGRDRVFFPILGHVHANYRTPTIAITLTALMAIALVVATAVAKRAVQDVEVEHLTGDVLPLVVRSLQTDSLFSLLTNFVIFSASIFYSLSVLAVIVLRVRRPEWDRPYRTLGYPFAPLAFLAVYVWFLTQVYQEKPLESRLGLVLIAAGVPVYWVYGVWSRRRDART